MMRRRGTNARLLETFGTTLACIAPAFAALVASAQTPQPAIVPSGRETQATQPATAEASPLAVFAWLEGCWRGSVNQRDYREQWMPLRGNLMVGMSQTVSGSKTQDFEYLRIEPRADGIYYVAAPAGKAESAFRFVEETVDRENDRNDHIFTFASGGSEFPQRIVYRRASEGWLYATVEGKVGGADRQVVYPMRRIGCESGEHILR